MEILSEIQKYIKLFEINQKAKNLSQNTIVAYARIFDLFYDYLAGEVENSQLEKITDINNSFLANYLYLLKNDNMSDATRQLHNTVLQQFFWFIADTELEKYGILKSKVTGVKIKVADKEVESFTEADQSKIIGLINFLDKSNNFRDHRLSLILKLLLFHGIRIDELINLKWADIEEVYDENEGYIFKFWYTGKGKKERDLDFPISFTEKNFEIIKKHITSEFVIPGSTGNKSFRNSIYGSVKAILAKQGISNVWLHKFRHTFGQNKVNEEVNISTITELMGHATPAVTFKYYLRNNKKAKRKAILNGLPINNDSKTK